MHTLIEVLASENSAVCFTDRIEGKPQTCYFVERNSGYPWLYFYYKNGEPQGSVELPWLLDFIPVAHESIWW